MGDSNKKPKSTAIKKKAFLECYAKLGIINRVCESIGIHRTTFFQWRDRGAEFAKEFQLADEAFNESLEAEMDRRGKEGYLEPVFYQGKEVSAVRKYSDVLLIVRAKAKMPEKYKDRIEQEHKGKVIVSLKMICPSDPDEKQEEAAD